MPSIGYIAPGARVGVATGYVGTSATSGVAVRATSYVAQSAAAQRSVNSSNANDTAAGTGAQQVLITYYDNNMNGPFTETVTLSGTTFVNTVNTNIRYIERMDVVRVGSGGGNVGTIALNTQTAGGGSTFASIAASDNATFWCQHYVPAGKTCYITGLRAGADVVNGGATLQVSGDPNLTNVPLMNITGRLRHGSANQVMAILEWDPPLSVVGPNFIVVNEKPDAVTASTVTVSFDYFEQ
jgi:hypothetical protein